MHSQEVGDDIEGSGIPDRLAVVARLLRDLWGDGLPPGSWPWRRTAADVLLLDDENGRRRGLTVQGDAVPSGVLAALLTYVPADAPVRASLPPAIITPVTRGRFGQPLEE